MIVALPSPVLSVLASLQVFAWRVSAQTFNGPGLYGGVDQAAYIEGPAPMTLRAIVLVYLYAALGFLAMAAVIMIVVAGVWMILSAGNETAKDRAKKIVLYTIIGLVIVFIARSVVGFFLYGLP